jgi:hypothetical protein
MRFPEIDLWLGLKGQVAAGRCHVLSHECWTEVKVRILTGNNHGREGP